MRPQFNASYENYFARGGLISVAGFYKQVDNFVETQNIATLVNDDFGGTMSTSASRSTPARARSTASSSARNMPSAITRTWLDGLRLRGELYPFGIGLRPGDRILTTHSPIPGVAEERVQPDRLLRTRRLLAPRVLFVARQVGQRLARSARPSPSPTRTACRGSIRSIQAPYGQLDGQIAYDITRNIGVVAQVQNLTDAVQHTYLQFPDQPFTYDRSGRRYWLGVKFKL